MLMHAIAHGDFTNAVRESAPKVDTIRKIPCRTGESNLPQRRAGPTLYQLSYIPALVAVVVVVVAAAACFVQIIFPLDHQVSLF